MQITPEIAIYVLLLLPGLLGHAVFCAFTYTAKPSWSGRTVVAVILSIVAYLSLVLLRECSLFWWLPDPHALLTSADQGLHGILSAQTILCVFAACVLAFVYSLALVRLQNRQALHRFAAKLGLTTKSGYVSEWDAVMIERARDRWVLVAMKDGSMFQGWLRSHDVSSSDRCIVLSNVREYTRDNGNFLWADNDLFVVNGLSDVRFLRLIPNEVSHEQTNAAKPAAPTAELPTEVRESKPESPAEGSTAGGPDTADVVAGETRQVTVQSMPQSP